jgi:predicted kinase
MDPELARIRKEKWKKQKEQQAESNASTSSTPAGVEIFDVDENEDENENDHGGKNKIAIDSTTTRSSHTVDVEIIGVDADDNDDGGCWETVVTKPKRKLKKTNVIASIAGATNNASYSKSIHGNGNENGNVMILLVGLPGSGKSHFAQALARRNKKYIRISQDVLKTRPKCESLCRRTLQDGNIPIIDRCNFDSTQRQHFLNIAAEFESEFKDKDKIPVAVDCIVFRYSAQTCITRCEERMNHETVDRQKARGVVMAMERSFSPPGLGSGGSSQSRSQNNHGDNDIAAYRVVREVTQFRDANNLVSEYVSGNGP